MLLVLDHTFSRQGLGHHNMSYLDIYSSFLTGLLPLGF